MFYIYIFNRNSGLSKTDTKSLWTSISLITKFILMLFYIYEIFVSFALFAFGKFL